MKNRGLTSYFHMRSRYEKRVMPFAESVKSPCYDMYRHYLWHIGCEKALTLGQEALPLVKQAFAFGCKGVKWLYLWPKG